MMKSKDWNANVKSYLFSQEPLIERLSEREINHSVVQDCLGHELAKELKLIFHFRLVTRLAVSGDGERIESGVTVDILNTLAVST